MLFLDIAPLLECIIFIYFPFLIFGVPELECKDHKNKDFVCCVYCSVPRAWYRAGALKISFPSD